MLRIRTDRYAERFVGEALWRSKRGEVVGGGELEPTLWSILAVESCGIVALLRGKAMTVRTWIHRG